MPWRTWVSPGWDPAWSSCQVHCGAAAPALQPSRCPLSPTADWPAPQPWLVQLWLVQLWLVQPLLVACPAPRPGDGKVQLKLCECERALGQPSGLSCQKQGWFLSSFERQGQWVSAINGVQVCERHLYLLCRRRDSGAGRPPPCWPDVAPEAQAPAGAAAGQRTQHAAAAQGLLSRA